MNKTSQHPILIGCETIITEALPFLDRPISFEAVEAGLHADAARLTTALRAATARADGRFDPIILGYGLCANAVVGIKTEKSTLIVPRVDDCIAAMLGSSATYRAVMKENPGAFFLSRGWIISGITPLDEFRQLSERYGEARARRLQKQMFRHYQQLVYVDTKGDDDSGYEAQASAVAGHMELAYQKIKGTADLLKTMVQGPWDDRFIVCPPGRAIALSDFALPEASPQGPLRDRHGHRKAENGAGPKCQPS